jgi:hypothetical protein
MAGPYFNVKVRVIKDYFIAGQQAPDDATARVLAQQKVDEGKVATYNAQYQFKSILVDPDAIP